MYVYICMYVCMCVYICMYVCVYIYIYIRESTESVCKRIPGPRFEVNCRRTKRHDFQIRENFKCTQPHVHAYILTLLNQR